MFFQPHEKRIYTPNIPGAIAYDPLRIDNLLIIHSNNTVDKLLTDLSPDDGKGDVSEEGKTSRSLLRATAEINLAIVARKAFGLPDFPETTDGEALEYLFDYLEYMKGKGKREG